MHRQMFGHTHLFCMFKTAKHIYVHVIIIIFMGIAHAYILMIGSYLANGAAQPVPSPVTIR